MVDDRALEIALVAAMAIATIFLVVVTYLLVQATRGLERATNGLEEVTRKDFERRAPSLRLENADVFYETPEGKLSVQVAIRNTGSSPAVVRALRVTEEFLDIERDEEGFPDRVTGTSPGATDIILRERFEQVARIESGERVILTAELRDMSEPRDIAGYTVVAEADGCPESRGWARMHVVEPPDKRAE